MDAALPNLLCTSRAKGRLKDGLLREVGGKLEELGCKGFSAAQGTLLS